MVLNISGKANTKMDDINFQFAMYNPEIDTVEVNTGTGRVLFISCNDFNSKVNFDDPNDVVYLYHLAKEQPLTYAKFSCQG